MNLKYGKADIKPFKSKKQAIKFADEVTISNCYHNIQIREHLGLYWVLAYKDKARAK